MFRLGVGGESAVHKVKVIAFPFLAFLFTTHIGGSCKLASYLVNLITKRGGYKHISKGKIQGVWVGGRICEFDIMSLLTVC